MYRIWFERRLPPEFAPLLNGIAEALGPAGATPEDPLSALPDAHAVIASVMRYDAAVMERGAQVRVIARTGIGYDKIALAEATARGIVVCNVPDGPTIPTAEHALALILGVAKKIKHIEHELRHTDRRDFFTDYNALELYQKRLGLVGLGRIGSHVARVARALGMEVVAFDPFVAEDHAQALGVTLLPDLTALLNGADVVSLHVPLTPETRHLINAEALAQMKPGAIFINTARGGLVDETALLRALETGRLAGAGLDVTDPEPPARDNPLLHRPDVIVTPHIASASRAGKTRMYTTAIEQALQVLRGERPPHVVNPEVWERRKPPPLLG